MHEIFNGTGPSYLSEQFIKVSDVHHHFTRGCTENFIVPSVYGVAATTFYYSGIKDWNSLPSDVKQKCTFNELMESDTYAYYLYAFSISILHLRFLSPPLLTVLDLTNRTPLEISLRAFMGYPRLFQHSYILPLHHLSLK